MPQAMDVDWDAVRLDYETTGVSLDQLCARHGIPWKTTLFRKARKCGWQRLGTEVVARLSVLEAAGEHTDVAAALANAARAEVAAGARQPGTSRRKSKKHDADASPTGDAAGGASQPGISRRKSEKHDGDAPPPLARPPVPDALTAELLTMQAIARLHSERIRRQLAIAAEIEEVGLAVLRQVKAYLDLPLDADDDEARLALQRRVNRLVGANPDRETLSGLMKAAADVIARGVTLERHALGMDTVKGELPADPAQSAPPGTRSAAASRLIGALDMDVAMRVRDAAKRLAEERRSGGPVIDGTAT